MTATVATQPLGSASALRDSPPQVTWNKLPKDFILPDDPVDDQLQPLLAEALRESLDLAGLILESVLIATNFGLCATVAAKTVVKAPDWVYIPQVKPLAYEVIRRSYTPQLEGDIPLIVLEFISETEGTEYSINPHYPYGKWYFYERILRVPLYGIFNPQTKQLDLFRLREGKYEPQSPNEDNRFWIGEMNLFLGTWTGKRAHISTTWLRWWDSSGNLLPWGKEMLEQERERAEQAESQLERERTARRRLEERLRALGLDDELDAPP